MTSKLNILVLLIISVALTLFLVPFNVADLKPISTPKTPVSAKDVKGAGDKEPILRVVGLGDFHGDLKSASRAMEMAGLINKKREWIAGKTVFVQTVCDFSKTLNAPS